MIIRSTYNMGGIFYHFTYMCDKIKNERDKI